MKPARERFFPTPSTPRAGSGPTFITNPDNPPHRTHSSSSGERRRTQDSVVLSALDGLQNTGMNRPLTQMGYPAFMKKLTMGANALTAGRITRPGTAEPRLSEDRGMNVRIENGNIPVMAPTPKKYHHMTPPFALPDGPFGSESLDVSRDNHSSKSPDNLIEGNAHIFSYLIQFLLTRKVLMAHNRQRRKTFQNAIPEKIECSSACSWSTRSIPVPAQNVASSR